jgi:KTSC domain-containing protein
MGSNPVGRAISFNSLGNISAECPYSGVPMGFRGCSKIGDSRLAFAELAIRPGKLSMVVDAAHEIAARGLTTIRSVLAISLSIMLTGSAFAETVFVKYRGAVPLDSFDCTDTSRSSFVKRVCYDAAKSYMIISLKGTYYHYCEIDAQTIDDLLAAPSIGRFYLAHIKGTGTDGPFDCRTHRAPDY